MIRATLAVVMGLATVFALAPALPAAADYTAPGAGMFGPMGPGFGSGPAMSGVGLRGCEWGRQTAPASALTELPRATVNIYDGTFAPNELSVRPGTLVVWANRGSSPHSATSWGFWDSGVLRAGDSCATWFVTPGTYQFLSIVAADGGTMTGTITVEGPPIGS